MRSFLAVLATLTCAAGAWAQIGDRLDRAGEVQKSLVPAEQVPPSPALTPAEALAAFKLAPGIQLELAAAEPLVEDPVAIAFGPDGRMWVVEMRGYMPDLDGSGEDAPVGRVVVLRDRDGDGHYDESTVFVDGLVLPRAIMLVGDGVLVGAPPELVYWRDTDGDGQADQKIVVASDYGVRVDPARPYLANPERAPNSPLWAADNWIYSTAYPRRFRFVHGRFESGPTNFRGQWGLSQDDFGRLYYNSNSDQLRVDVIAAGYLARNADYPRPDGTNVNAAADQFVWPARVTPGVNRGYRPEMLRDGRLKEFTAACAPWIYRGDLLPEFYGNAFVAEPSANLVRRNLLADDADGVPHAHNAYDRQEFIASTDERFRPVNFATGPDGALYIVDLYRGVLQHRISLTSYLRQQSEERKLVAPRHLGRIYRVVPDGRPAPRAVRPSPVASADWVERLSDANSWWRETAQRTLVERRDPAVAPALRHLATSGAQALGRAHALRTLEGMDAIDPATTIAAFGDRDPVVRATAIRVAERFLNDPAAHASLTTRLLKLAEDASPEVQRQAVLSLGNAQDPAIHRAVADVVRRHPRVAFLRDAFFSGLEHRELAVLEQLAADPAWTADAVGAAPVLSGLARGVFLSRQPEAIERALALGARVPAVLDGFSAAANGLRRPIALEREPVGWAALLDNGARHARLVKIDAALSWPGKAGAKPAALALNQEQQTRFATGRTLFTTICAACHQPTGRGLDGLAPPLLDSEWLLGPAPRPIRIVLHGVRGPIVVAGRTHAGDMPGFGKVLDDDQIAAVLTYLRREWGHAASPVAPDQVKSIRAETAAHVDAWSPEELMLVK